jgi:prevent-host-death family protein
MRKVNVAEAKTHLSELIQAVLDGEDVVIARNGTPMVKLVAADPVRPREVGFFGGPAWIAEDFDAPLEDFAEYGK